MVNQKKFLRGGLTNVKLFFFEGFPNIKMTPSGAKALLMLVNRESAIMNILVFWSCIGYCLLLYCKRWFNTNGWLSSKAQGLTILTQSLVQRIRIRAVIYFRFTITFSLNPIQWIIFCIFFLCCTLISCLLKISLIFLLLWYGMNSLISNRAEWEEFLFSECWSGGRESDKISLKFSI